MLKRAGCLFLALLTVLSLAVPAFGDDARPEPAAAKASVKLATPVIKSASVTANGVKLTWGAVDGAARYRVFYRTTGNWKKVGDTRKTSLVWTKAKSGVTYTFTVRCLSADGKGYTSSYDKTGRTVTYIAAPSIKKASVIAGGVKLTWSPAPGAAKYRVFYKTTGGWKKAGDTGGTSLVWTKAKSGVTYTFTVRCLSADGKNYTSSYDKTGKTLTYIAAPSIKKASVTADGVKLTWNAVPGAAKYRVFYKTTGGWKKAGDTDGTGLTWTKAQSGVKYTFTARCLSADGESYTSAYNKTGKTLTYVAAPSIIGADSTARGVSLQWNAAPGAAKYRVFYRTTGGWKKAGDTTDTSYLWTKAQNGVTYTFTVRCLSANGKKYLSSYDKTGKTITYSYASIRPLDNLAKTSGLNQQSRGCCMATSFSMAANLILGRDEYGAFDWTAGPYSDGLSVPGGTAFEGTDGYTYKPYTASVSSADDLRLAIDTALAEGCPIIASVQSQSTAATHYVVVVGWVNEDHYDYLIADPAIAGGGSIEACAVPMIDYRGFSLGNKNGTFVYITFSRA